MDDIIKSRIEDSRRRTKDLIALRAALRAKDPIAAFDALSCEAKWELIKAACAGMVTDPEAVRTHARLLNHATAWSKDRRHEQRAFFDAQKIAADADTRVELDRARRAARGH